MTRFMTLEDVNRIAVREFRRRNAFIRKLTAMAKLTSKSRNKLTEGQFAGPDRSYPVPDKSHAVNAKARASEMEHKGRISKGTEARIDAKANRVLKRKG